MLGIYFDGLFFDESHLIDNGSHSVFYHYLNKRYDLIKSLSINNFTHEVDDVLDDSDNQDLKISSLIYQSILNSSIKTYDDTYHNYLLSIALFYENYLSKDKTLEVKTSGSTSEPKIITVKKEQMKNSALKTINYLHLEKEQSALICMPLDFIAGKMMLLRALFANMELKAIKPCINPLLQIHNNLLITELVVTSLIKESAKLLNSDDVNSKDSRERFDKKAILKIDDNVYILDKKSSALDINFIAITTMQAFEIAENEGTLSLLCNMDNILIGGGAISTPLYNKLLKLNGNVYQSYGMTETLSHIALKNISKGDKHYHCLDNVEVSLSDKDTLVIRALDVSDEILYTNDLAVIYDDKSFDIVGRVDNVINTGGLKVVADEMEEIIRENIKLDNLYISYVDDAKLGQKIALVIEDDLKSFCKKYKDKINLDFTTILNNALDKYLNHEDNFHDNCCSYGSKAHTKNVYLNLDKDNLKDNFSFIFNNIDKNKRAKLIFFVDTLPYTSTYKIKRLDLHKKIQNLL